MSKLLVRNIPLVIYARHVGTYDALQARYGAVGHFELCSVNPSMILERIKVA